MRARNLRRQSGQALVELSLTLVFIAILLVGSLSLTGKQVSTVYGQINNGFGSAATVANVQQDTSGGTGTTGNTGNNGSTGGTGSTAGNNNSGNNGGTQGNPNPGGGTKGK